MVSTPTTDDAERTNLVNSHCEGMNIHLLRRVGVRSLEPHGVYLLRCHITKKASLAGRCGIYISESWIGDDPRNLKVSNASFALLGDKNVPLDR